LTAISSTTVPSMRFSSASLGYRLGISERTLRYKIARMRDSGVAVPG